MMNTPMPFIVFWIAMPISAYTCSFISLTVCVFMPLVFIRHEKIPLGYL